MKSDNLMCARAIEHKHTKTLLAQHRVDASKHMQ